MKKLAIAMPVNGRYELTRRVINSLLKHRDYWTKEVAIKIFLGTHEDFYFNLANAHPWAIEAVKLDNNPLGRKFNDICDAAANWGDYFVLLGSDDILSPDYFLMATEAMELNKPWAALNQAYICELETLQTRFVRLNEGSLIGGGLLTKSVAWQQLREVYGQVYPEKQSKGLDGQAFGRYKELYGPAWVMHTFKPVILCTKGETNIWPFYLFANFAAVPFDKLHENFIDSDLLTLEQYKEMRDILQQGEKHEKHD